MGAIIYLPFVLQYHLKASLYVTDSFADELHIGTRLIQTLQGSPRACVVFPSIPVTLIILVVLVFKPL